jgi:glycosyltransferase involved in cell wall biosynthesis
MEPVRYSVIVPAFNEADYLPRLLDSVDVARQRFPGGVNAVEVLVADNACTDDTAAIAAARGCSVVTVARRCIAAARNGGAGAARGEVFCFVDADTRVHPDTFTAIDARMADGDCAGGATGWTLERWSAGIFCTALVVWPALRLTGINAGVVFCRADVFRAVGGYDETRQFAEDVAFFRAMRAEGRRRGLRTVRSTATPALLSARKFDRHGDWHMLMLWWWVIRNRSLGRTVEDYWYNPTTRF